jgi:myo-inositol-1(or 4)-monophosphatase
MMKATLIKALNTAGRIQKERFSTSLNISLKESISSIVTEVDVTCEKEIIETIRQSFASHNLLGEESGFINHGSDYTWVIDPLDGTSNYAAGIPWFGVLIAVFEKQNPVMAGAYLPIEDILYLAEKDNGTYINDRKTIIQPVDLSTALFAFSTDYTRDEEYLEKGLKWYKYLVKKSRNIRTTNSLIDLMFVLEGKFGGCINLFTKVWDIGAPYLLIKEAGGVMTGLDGKAIVFELSENAFSTNYPIIAGHESLVNKLLVRLQKF